MGHGLTEKHDWPVYERSCCHPGELVGGSHEESTWENKVAGPGQVLVQFRITTGDAYQILWSGRCAVADACDQQAAQREQDKRSPSSPRCSTIARFSHVQVRRHKRLADGHDLLMRLSILESFRILQKALVQERSFLLTRWDPFQ